MAKQRLDDYDRKLHKIDHQLANLQGGSGAQTEFNTHPSLLLNSRGTDSYSIQDALIGAL